MACSPYSGFMEVDPVNWIGIGNRKTEPDRLASISASYTMYLPESFVYDDIDGEVFKEALDDAGSV